MLNIRKIAVGISGGVDSAVAAYLLKNKGYEVEGVFMQNWDIIDEQGTCSSDADYKDAQFVCDKLNIKLHHVNFVKSYWNEVFCNFIKDYNSGLTPNPDILCNRYIKFNHFYKYAIERLDMDAIATGHYARTNFGFYLENYHENKKVKLLRGVDEVKDQTFFLCQVEQNALRKTIFPLGNFHKQEVKFIARLNGLDKIANKKESMGICFIGSRNFQDFISEYVDDKPGNFIDIDTGKIVGRHRGLHHWTLGQRSRIEGMPEPYFIAKKNLDDNSIYVAMGSKHPFLHSKLFFTSKPHWICEKPEELAGGGILHCQFKFQHTHDLVDCEICEIDKGLVVKLFKGKRALTEGQFAVFYKGEECLGSGQIVCIGTSNFIYYYLQNNKIMRITDILRNKSAVKL